LLKKVEAEEHRLASDPPLLKTFLSFVIPLIMANVLQALSGTVNSIYLGHMIGVDAFAAASAFLPLQMLFTSLIVIFQGGAGVLIGQAYGAGELIKIKAIAGTALLSAMLVGTVIAIAGAVLARPLLGMLGTPADVLDDSTSYARVMFLCMILSFAFMLVMAMMRAVGDTKTPLFAILLTTVIGLVATPALIAGWGGLPALGVTGAAWGTFVSFAVTLVWLVFHLRRRDHPVAPDAVLFQHIRIDRPILRTLLFIGVSVWVQILTMSLAQIVLLRFANRFGSDATAAYGAISQVMSYVQFPIVGITIASSVISAQAIGAGRTDQIGKIARVALMINFAFTGGLALVAYIFSRPLIGFFITSIDVIELARVPLYIMLWSTILVGMSAVLSSVMRAGGTVVTPALLTTFAIVALQAPLAYMLSERVGFNGVWIGYLVAWTANAGILAVYYRAVWTKTAPRKLF
jgi:putative MATE family efflux protein